jgi:hypothetical protein
MDVQVNMWAVLLAAIASMVVGSVWYAKPVFGKLWMDLVKLDEAQQRKGAMKAMVMAFVAALLTAYVLAHVIYLSNSFFQNSFMKDAMQTAFWLWLGISATTIATHHAFEQRPKKLTWLAIGNQLVTFLVMAFIIGWLKP